MRSLAGGRRAREGVPAWGRTCSTDLRTDQVCALAAFSELHRLPKDIGSQAGVPRHQRLCQLCGADYGDEMHLVFECHGLADLREQFERKLGSSQAFSRSARLCSISCGSPACCRLPNS